VDSVSIDLLLFVSTTSESNHGYGCEYETFTNAAHDAFPSPADVSNKSPSALGLRARDRLRPILPRRSFFRHFGDIDAALR
jgi:hypothetical protein